MTTERITQIAGTDGGWTRAGMFSGVLEGFRGVLGCFRGVLGGIRGVLGGFRSVFSLSLSYRWFILLAIILGFQP